MKSKLNNAQCLDEWKGLELQVNKVLERDWVVLGYSHSAAYAFGSNVLSFALMIHVKNLSGKEFQKEIAASDELIALS